jgi:hypothetical protein
LRRRLAILSIALCLLPGRPVVADPPLEYQVKAVCVLNATRFVSWPATVSGSPSSPLIIGVLGVNPFGDALKEAVRGETVQKRPIVVQEVNLAEAAGCHVVFISRSEEGRIAEVLQRIGQNGVFTVSEIDGFAANGGMLGLALHRGTVRFEVNAEAVHRSKLKVDSRLLRLAKIVK